MEVEVLSAPRTLAEILSILGNLDLVSETSIEIKPEEILGDLKDKVDAIYTVLERLEREADRLDSIAEDFKLAARRVKENRERLKEYVRFTMTAQGFEKLPGNHWRLQLQKTAPSLAVEREATADDLLANPNLVKRTVSYAWDKNAVKEHIAAGGSFGCGKLVEGKTVRFYINRGEPK